MHTPSPAARFPFRSVRNEIHALFNHSYAAGIAIPWVALLFSIIAVSSAIAAPPPNDNFSGRIALTAGVTVTANTSQATIEPNERTADAHHTIWYTWTAPSDSIVSIDNIGSEIYEAFIAVYMGSSLDKLAYVADGSAYSNSFRFSFPVKAGTTFQIVAGDDNSSGGKWQITLTTQPFTHAGPLFGPEEPDSRRPFNDSFIRKSTISGSTLTAISYNGGATKEGGEPNRPFDDVYRTVWFRWTAPSNSTVTIDTTGTSVSGHLFAVYVGDSIEALATVAGATSNDTDPTTATFPARAGTTYTILAASRYSSTYGTLVLTLTSAPPYTGSLLNISTRMKVGTGNDVLIGGFIITGGPKEVVIRAIGPSLAQFRIANPLSDPFLELHNAAGTLVSQNNNWQDNPSQASAIQASGLAPKDPRESALRVTLGPGNHTAVVRGVNNAIGVGLVEVYDTEGGGAPSKAANVATRGFVSTGDSVMIAGFIVGGNSPAHLIVRGIGPSLANFGIINALQNPQLELYDEDGRRLTTVDNWQDASNYGQVVAAGLAPSDLRESAISGSFDPGNYTVVLKGLNNTTGVGLVEVYNQAP